MGKILKNKLFLLVLSSVALLGACKKNEAIVEEKLSSKNNLAIHGDGKWDALGFGYDITGELFSTDNTSDAPIIDVDRFNTDYPNRINTPTDTYGYTVMYSGATALDYVNDVNTKETYGLTASVGEKDKDTFGSANFSKTNEDQTTYTYNSKYSYASFESRVRIKSITFTGDATLELLRNYLTPLFVANLSTLSGDALVERYGTHVLLGISIGGRLKYDYKGAVVKETTADRKLRAIKAGFSIGVDKIFGVSLSSDVSTEEKTTISNETTEKGFEGNYYGGTNGGTSFSGDAAGNTSQAVNIAGWQQSITVYNATLVDITRSVPLYELITDPAKKSEVKAAVEKYISERKLTLVYETKQLYRCYNATNNDRLLTANPSEVSGLPGWQVEGPFAKVYSDGIKTGTIPLYRFLLKNGTHLHSLNRNEINSSTGTYEGITGYVNNVAETNNIQIYRYYNSAGKHMYSNTFNELGYGRNGWIYEGNLGYALN